ncbi:MAG: GNAT family N-acetyltransferase [Humibacter sp.]
MPVLETERLTLRPWRVDDADIAFAFDLYSRWEVQRYIGRVPRVMADRDEAATRVARYAAEESSATHSLSVVERRDTGEPVGVLLLKPIPASGPTEPLQPSGDIEIGWHFHPDHWGQGFATEAARAVLQPALAAGLPRVVAVTNPENVASQKVCLRIGMRDVGLSGDYYNTTCRLFVAP